MRVLASMHALCALQLVALSGAAALHLSLLVLYAVVALGAVLSALVRPATSALVPRCSAAHSSAAGGPPPTGTVR